MEFTKEKQQEFIEEKLDRFADILYDELRNSAQKNAVHVPEETLRNLSYKIVTDRPGMAAEFILSFQDSGRIVDMRRLDYRGRAISQDENFIKNWAQKKGITIFRKRQIPGYKSGKDLPEEKKLERIANAIIVAKGSQARRKPIRRTWRYNQIVYSQIDELRELMRKDQAAWLKENISKDLEDQGSITFQQ